MKFKGKFVLLTILSALIFLYLTNPYLPQALYYNYVGIDDYPIFDNREVETGSPIDWPVKLWRESLPGDIDSVFQPFEPVAFLIVQHDTIRFEKYWDDYGPHSWSNSFSMAKSIIGLLIGKAIEEGKIQSLDQPAADFIPVYRDQAPEMTIENLLTMSSGLNWDESYGSPFSLTTQAYYGEDLPSLIDDLKTIEPPGVVWKYLSGNTQVLGMILMIATGKSISEYASEVLWKPLGAQNKALWSLDHEGGTEKAYCCFNSNARDFARLGQLLIEQGEFFGSRIINEAYISAATTPASYLIDDEGKPVDHYGYQFWLLNHKGYDVVYYRGILGQYIMAIPDLDMVVVRLGHQRSSEKLEEHPKDVFIYLDTALKLLTEQRNKIPS